MKKLILALFFTSLLYSDAIAQPTPDAVVIPQNTRFGQRFIPERRSSDRQTSQSGTGAIWFNTTEQQWKGDTGVSIVPIGQGGGGQSPGPQGPNTVNAGPVAGSAANPTFRTLVAADIPILDAAKIGTGLIPTARGGTGIGNFAIGDLLYANTTSTLARLALGTAGQCLIVSGGLPIWSACPGGGGGGGITSLNGLSASTQVFGNDTNVIISSAGSTHTLGWSGLLGLNRGGTNAATSQGAINNISQLVAQGDLLFHNGLNSTRLPRGITGQCLIATSTSVQWQACPGGITNITSGNFSPLFTVSIANPSTTPDISFVAISQSQNLFFASPNGSSGVPSFRAMAAADVPSLDASKITSGLFAVARIPNLSTIPTGLTVSRCLRTDAVGFITIHTADCGNINGTGTNNTIAKWTGTSTQGNSALTDDGTNLQYGTGNTGTFLIGKITLSGSDGTTGDCLKSAGGGANTWGACGTGGGSGSFTDLTSGTNTTAAMVVGSGSSLNYSGSGTINATTIGGNQVAKAHWGKTVAPATSDNTASGHGDADMWGDTTNNNVYIKLEEAAGSASWLRFVIANAALGTPSSGTLTNATGLPLSTGISGLGTGIATALAVNTGSTGAPVLFNGAGGTPSSLVLTNATGLPTSAQAADAKVRTCELIYGVKTSGATAIPNDDDVPDICSNLTGSTMTIVSVECKANTGDMTVTPIVSGGASNSILSGALTCGNGSFASGSLNGTPTQSNGATLDFNVTAGGTATYAVLRIKRTL